MFLSLGRCDPRGVDPDADKHTKGKLSIHDIIGEDSLVMYWTKFGQIAFDATKKAMLASCTLKRPDRGINDRSMRCCFSFTVQRDEHLM